MRRLKVFGIGMLILAILIVSLYNTHPIILKCALGEVNCVGKPLKALVYTDGRQDNNIKVFKSRNTFILYLPVSDHYQMLRFILLNPSEKWVGRPVGTDRLSYDFVLGYLFQDQTGAHFVDFRDDMKGYNFDPSLKSTTNEITFNMPPNRVGFNTMRIKLLEDQTN